ncbi:MAG: RAMP superfamily CRISPR-associated protein [Dehalococcoidia bacterium]|nr:RAMP superfamily CRISPR-associated protein [Dehalococcoidia bacterium]
MTFEYCAWLKEKLSSGGMDRTWDNCGSRLADECLVQLLGSKDKQRGEIRDKYMVNIRKDSHCLKNRFTFLSQIGLDSDFRLLPDPNWLAIEVSFTLMSPWYSKDDVPLHVLDNPVKKDRVFGVPFMSASSWKGLLRWSCRMSEGLVDHLSKNKMSMDNWEDPPWIVHLFGNERREREDFSSGALVFFPTWFDTLDFEVINPHSRAKRAGTAPIYYEVVPPGTKGKLKVLYAPLPTQVKSDGVRPGEFIESLVDSIKSLLEKYGISAKRTVGWGTAKIDDKGWRLYPGDGNPVTAEALVGEVKRRSSA